MASKVHHLDFGFDFDFLVLILIFAVSKTGKNEDQKDERERKREREKGGETKEDGRKKLRRKKTHSMHTCAAEGAATLM